MAKLSDRDLLADRVDDLRASLRSQNPDHLATRTGSSFQRLSPVLGEFHLDLWARPIRLSFPSFVARDPGSGAPLASFHLALLLYYFTTCDGTPPTGQWISFSELPGGRFYNQAFQGYTGRLLVNAFQNNLPGFCEIAAQIGGTRVLSPGDAAFTFQALPLVSLMVVAWQGDEEVQPAYQVLFDAAVSHHLPTDVCAILGSSLTRQLIQTWEQHSSLLSPVPSSLRGEEEKG
jgi:hypothetical protein